MSFSVSPSRSASGSCWTLGALSVSLLLGCPSASRRNPEQDVGSGRPVVDAGAAVDAEPSENADRQDAAVSEDAAARDADAGQDAALPDADAIVSRDAEVDASTSPPEAGADDPAARTEAALRACAAYREAQCRRLRECGMLDDDGQAFCEERTLDCATWAYAKGAWASVEALEACVIERREVDCSRVWIGPDCVDQKGTLEPGESCLYGIQCRSGRCDVAYDESGAAGCGVCEPGLEFGDACTPDGEPCPLHGTCDASGVCTPVLLAAEGGACETDGSCLSPLRCLQQPDLTGRCGSTLPAEGEACVPAYTNRARVADDNRPVLICGPSLYCDLTGAEPVCAQLPGEGEPCKDAAPDPDVPGPDYNRLGACATGLRCDFSSDPPYICRTPGALGEPCHHYSGELTCEPGLICRWGAAECEPPIPPGGRCINTSHRQCEVGYQCVQVDGRARCLSALGGEDCEGTGDCLPGYTCDEGACRPPEVEIGADPCPG